MYTKISCITIVAAILLILMVLFFPGKSSKKLIYVFVCVGVDFVLLLVGTVCSVIAVVKERTVLSQICLAVFIAYFALVVIMVCRAAYRRRFGKRIK